MFFQLLKSYWYIVVITVLTFLYLNELKSHSQVHTITVDRIVIKEVKVLTKKKIERNKVTTITSPEGQVTVITDNIKKDEVIAKVKNERDEVVYKEETRSEKESSPVRFGLGIGGYKPLSFNLYNLAVLGTVSIRGVPVDLLTSYKPLINEWELGIIWKF